MPLELQKCLRKLNQPTEQRSVNPFCPENAQKFTQKITNSYGKFEKFTFPLKIQSVYNRIQIMHLISKYPYRLRMA